MPLLTELLIWNDLIAHTGEENMAIDELLLRQIADIPLLRVYRWSKPSVSFGYFESLQSAKTSFPDDIRQQSLNYIRRWTGGGIVDHRIGLTYTLIIPKSHPIASLRGAESYSIVHQAVADALNKQGVDCRLTQENISEGSGPCFTNPVAYDIISSAGSKLAGAGQKRSRYGLLHQGSVINIIDKEQWLLDFRNSLTESSQPWNPPSELFRQSKQLSQEKYASPAWLRKR